LSENILPMQESGQLNFIKRPTAISWKIRTRFWIFFADGIPKSKWFRTFNTKTKLLFSVLIGTYTPSVAYVMGYDTRPLLTMPEKNKILECCRR
jgi:hypothetical protein